MIETRERDIDGIHLAVSQLPAMKALRLSATLGKLFGTPLARALSTIDITNIGASDVTAVGAAMLSLFEGLSPDQLEALTKELLGPATADGKPLLATFDLVFAGKVDTIYKVLGFALEVNYGSFFDVLRALGVRAKAAQVQPKVPASS